jgi:hypothetical protein
MKTGIDLLIDKVIRAAQTVKANRRWGSDLVQEESYLEKCVTALRAEFVEWVPVSKTLPLDYERVLVFDGSNNSRHVAYHIASIPQWSTTDGVFYHGDMYSWITHWQPLSPIPAENA